ncbi:MAG: hypothetical protein K0S44_552 [Bacteroidetes bacterium]|jgi:hypothetical protein|nr:hypothetical protein [Bacteroidota bacterium]
MKKDPIVDKKKFEEEGYLVVKNVFSPEEIEQFRSDAYKQYENDSKKGLNYDITKTNARSLRGDLLSKDLMRKIILDERVLDIARKILGPDIVYFGDSNFQFGVGFRGFHRDNVDREFNNGPDWDGDYNIIRMGLYLQDHSKYSGGLKIKKGSHKNASGKSIILNTSPGDLALWSLRTLHSGNAVRLKLMPNFSVDYFERFVPAFLKVDEPKERVGCFFTFGVKGKHLDRYISEYMLKAKPVLENLKNSPLNEGVLDELKSKKVTLIRPMVNATEQNSK